VFIGVNKCMTGIFVFCYFGYLWSVRELEKDGEHGGHGHDHGDHHHHGEHNHHDHGHHNHHHHHEESLDTGHTCCQSGSGIFNPTSITLSNTLLPLPLLFLTYDFFYTLLHWALHMRFIYAYIHKHHHHQKAPSRANVDAVNVHPLEFFLGEFNHVWTLHLVIQGMPLVGYKGMDVSWVGALLFIALGGMVAGLNHTRHDVVWKIPSLSFMSADSSNNGPEEDDATDSSDSSDDEKDKATKTNTNTKKKKKYWTIFDSKHHDVHHRIPQSNYGQYSVIWDRIFGTFREYNENDRVNPNYQLDDATGRTRVSSESAGGGRKED